MKQLLLKRSFHLSLEALGEIRHFLKKQMTLLSLPENTIQSLELVATEYLTNLVRHQTAPPTNITIAFFRHKSLYLQIGDNGEGWLAMRERLDSASLPTEAVTGGMGLGLIAALLPSYEYIFDPTNNRLNLELPSEITTPNILIIDDSPSQLALLRGFLSQVYTVTTFSSAEEALHWLASNDCSLVVTDLHMPGMNGFEFRHKAGQLPNKTLLPFVFLTGDKMQDTRDKAATQAIDDYLTKPIKRDVLLTSLSRVLSRHQHLEELYEQKLLSGLIPYLSFEDHQPQNPIWQLQYDCYPKLSGDFCISHQANNKNTIIIFGDQMGHGPLARANGAMWLGFIKGLLKTPNIGIADIIAALNQELCRSCLNQPHLLCLSAIELTQNGTVRIINAGLPDIVVCQEGTPKVASASTGLLGIDTALTPEVVTLTLANTDSLHVFSDGVLESPEVLFATRWPLELHQKHQYIWSASQDEHPDDRSLLSLCKR